MKSRRGAPKRIETQGFACPNQQCPYSGITDAYIHALVGDGKHGHAEQIQTFRGPACHTTFTARRNTPLYRLKTPSHHVAMLRISRWPKGWIFRLPNGSQGYRQTTITSLSDSRRGTCSDLARALLLPSPPPTPAVGRTTHQAAQRQAPALALAGHRPPLEMYSCAPCGPPHTKLSA
jgi:hypothetical protein